jgi:hypothetical protein
MGFGRGGALRKGCDVVKVGGMSGGNAKMLTKEGNESWYVA